MRQEESDRAKRPGPVPESFDEFYLREYPAVAGLLQGLLRSRLVAEELAQETFPDDQAVPLPDDPLVLAPDVASLPPARRLLRAPGGWPWSSTCCSSWPLVSRWSG